MKINKLCIYIYIYIYTYTPQAEWEGYIKGMREAGLVDDRPDPPYPYTIEDVPKHPKP